MAELVHLHVHSQYSMLDGAIRLKSLVGRVAEMGMRAVALTDHGNMFGAVQLHAACASAGIAPIVGCEVNLVGGRRDDEQRRDAHHLVLLADSDEGYQNLVRIVSRGWVEGLVRGTPRIDFEVLRDHKEGVVGLSACMGGFLAQEILMRGPAAGRSAMAALRDSFEPGKFFVELQDHGFPEQQPLNEILVELARDMSVPLVATNDCHYLDRGDARAQLALQCIGAGRTLEEMERTHHASDQLYLKSAEEMAGRFSHLPEAISNTLLVAEMCAGRVNPLSKPKLPSFQVPDGLTESDFLRKLSRDGLDQRFVEKRALGQPFDEPEYRDRLELELGVIIDMGFPGYFLIVQDFINWAKRAGVPVGPGRGSGAGSIVAWSLRITDLDPIPYGLLFERFLNPERVSMPDFDVDFCMEQRDRVIEYVRDKYGRQSVGQIATFHLLKSRSVVRDVGRVMGMPPADAGRIATLVPEPVQGKSVPIKDALEQEERLSRAYKEEPPVTKLLDTAMTLEDLTRHAGMHAAGVVISEGPLWDHVPVFCPEPNVYVTQYHKDDVESAGLVKFDFLGLKTLTVLDVAKKLIDKRPDREEPFDIAKIPLDDAATYALLSSGETTNVFQLESSGMQSLFKQLRPDCFEDIVAAVALYRPGPLGSGMVEDFVQRKHGRVAVAYPHPSLERTLESTYGVIVYQEQVMQIAREMAGYSLGGADLLRRAMGKKKAEEMAMQKTTFLDGAQKKGFSKEDADKVFDLMAYFAGYGFNKCVVGETRVFDAISGEETTVRSLFEVRRPFSVHALGEDGRLRPRRVTDVVSNGEKPVFELRTELGKRIVGTHNHPVRTPTGWTELGELVSGDRVAVPRVLSIAEPSGRPVDEIVSLADRLSKLPSDEEVPAIAHRLPDADLELFLGRLWASDGVGLSDRVAEPAYPVPSRRLAEDLQSLLLRLGIVSRIHEETGEDREAEDARFTVRVDEPFSREVFANRIVPHSAGQAWAEHATTQPLGSPGPEHDVYWDRVLWVGPRGWEETYDLTVEVDHNFVANGIVVHNSHSAAYALITYHTAYLKAHYPVEFVCATLSADKDKTEKVVRTVAEGRSMGITVLPPDVNESEIDFTVVYQADESGKIKRPKGRPLSHKGKIRDPMQPRIRFGLGGVRGVGGAALEAIFEARRAEDGEQRPFVDLFDFATRVDVRRVNKSVVEALIQCGAFDAVHEAEKVSRAMAMAAVEQAIERGKKMAAERSSGQTNLFGLFGGGDEEAARALARPGGEYPHVEAWDTRDLLAREKQTLGFYVSGHPLDRYVTELKRLCNAATDTLPALPEGTQVVVGGSVEGYRERNTKTGARIAFFSLEDPLGRVEVIVRPRNLNQEGVREVLTANAPVIVSGMLQFEGNRNGGGGGGGGGDEEAREAKIILEEVSPLAESLKKKTRSVKVRVRAERHDRMILMALRETLQKHPGACPVSLEIWSEKQWTVSLITTGLSVDPTDALMASVERLFGEKVCEFR